MEVKVGFKQTELGFVPDGWNLIPIEKIADQARKWSFTGGPFGSNLKSSDYTQDGVRVIQLQNIGDGVFHNDSQIYTSPEKANELISCNIYPNEIILSKMGDPVARAAIIPNFHDRYLMCSDGIRLSVNTKEHNNYFIFLSINFNYFRKQAESASTGSTRKRIGLSELRQLKVICPKFDEQNSIAEALSDADTLIESLENLIEKKRQIKQGAMQELLSGKKRLAGFSGEWVEKPLGEICHIKTGNRNNQDKVEDGQYPFFVRSSTVERINSYSHDCEAILIPGEGGIGSIFHYILGKFDVHQRVYAITQFPKDVCGKYIYLYMNVHFGFHAMQNSVKATVDSLRLPTFLEFKINLPPTKDEQEAIAEILSDMDLELTKLDSKLTKARQIKQGMMQDLLTGKIRLV